MTREEELHGTWCATCFHNDVCMSAEEGPQPELDGPCCLMYVTRLEGEWIQSDKDKYWAMCSVCKKEAIGGDFMILTDFCPNCGAYMRKGATSHD